MKKTLFLNLIFWGVTFQLISQTPNFEVEGDYKEHIRLTQTTGHIDLTASKDPLGFHILDTNNIKLLSAISVDAGNNSTIGRVGLGTAAPQSMLSLRGPDDYFNGPNILLTGKSSDQIESGRIRFVEGTATNNFRGAYLHYDGSANRFHIGVHSVNGSDLVDEINAISINRSNGFVGLGTPNPASQLHSFDGTQTTAQRKILGLFESTFNKRPTLFLSKSGTSVGYGIEYDGTVGSNLNKLKIFWKDVNQERNIITINNGTNAGRVGVNTSTPVTDFEVTSDLNPTLRITNPVPTTLNTNPKLQFDESSSTTQDWQLSTDAGGLLLSEGNASGAMTPLYKFDNDDFIPFTTNSINIGRSLYRFKGIFLTESPNVSSDRRLKKEIKPIDHGLEAVLKLNPVRYQLIQGDDRTTLGLIAQEVLPVIPEIVDVPQSSEDYYALHYTELIPVLIKAIQDQQKLIEGYKNTLQSMVADIENLKTINGHNQISSGQLNNDK
ncbi:MAG: tail fiber domain-containing protein [Saprospiraceae bacterium]|nr:tail fiber domain-containing protein [Saprospiraceae bacterium]